MLVLGTGVLFSTSNEPKSVCVDSVDEGPRSRDLGAARVREVDERGRRVCDLDGLGTEDLEERAGGMEA